MCRDESLVGNRVGTEMALHTDLQQLWGQAWSISKKTSREHNMGWSWVYYKLLHNWVKKCVMELRFKYLEMENLKGTYCLFSFCCRRVL